MADPQGTHHRNTEPQNIDPKILDPQIADPLDTYHRNADHQMIGLLIVSLVRGGGARQSCIMMVHRELGSRGWRGMIGIRDIILGARCLEMRLRFGVLMRGDRMIRDSIAMDMTEMRDCMR